MFLLSRFLVGCALSFELVTSPFFSELVTSLEIAWKLPGTASCGLLGLLDLADPPFGAANEAART